MTEPKERTRLGCYNQILKAVTLYGSDSEYIFGLNSTPRDKEKVVKFDNFIPDFALSREPFSMNKGNYEHNFVLDMPSGLSHKLGEKLNSPFNNSGTSQFQRVLEVMKFLGFSNLNTSISDYNTDPYIFPSSESLNDSEKIQDITNFNISLPVRFNSNYAYTCIVNSDFDNNKTKILSDFTDLIQKDQTLKNPFEVVVLIPVNKNLSTWGELTDSLKAIVKGTKLSVMFFLVETEKGQLSALENTVKNKTKTAEYDDVVAFNNSGILFDDTENSQFNLIKNKLNNLTVATYDTSAFDKTKNYITYSQCLEVNNTDSEFNININNPGKAINDKFGISNNTTNTGALENNFNYSLNDSIFGIRKDSSLTFDPENKRVDYFSIKQSGSDTDANALVGVVTIIPNQDYSNGPLKDDTTEENIYSGLYLSSDDTTGVRINYYPADKNRSFASFKAGTSVLMNMGEKDETYKDLVKLATFGVGQSQAQYLPDLNKYALVGNSSEGTLITEFSNNGNFFVNPKATTNMTAKDFIDKIQFVHLQRDAFPEFEFGVLDNDNYNYIPLDQKLEHKQYYGYLPFAVTLKKKPENYNNFNKGDADLALLYSFNSEELKKYLLYFQLTKDVNFVDPRVNKDWWL